MQETDIMELIDRIGTEPSVLLLGEMALSSYTGVDPYLSYVGWKKDRKLRNYRTLWELSNPMGEAQWKELNQFSGELVPLWWLRKILSMRWNLLYTTGVDSVVAHGVGPNFELHPIPTKSTFKRDYLSKQHLHVSYLFGSVDAAQDADLPPSSIAGKELKIWSRDTKIGPKLGWIYSEILHSYGVLVIDGWDPETDLLSKEDLLSCLEYLPYRSVFLFGATPALKEEIAGKELNDIVVCEERRFAQVLDESGFFDNLDADSFSVEEQTEDAVAITLGKGANAFRLRVPTAAVNALEPQITLLHDDLIRLRKPDPDERKAALATFLQQSDMPQWNLFSDDFGFYVNRENVDDSLWYMTNKEIDRESVKKPRPVLLKGASNTGKTAALIHLALQIQKERIAPVLFVRGAIASDRLSGFEGELKNFIKQHLFTQENRRIVVIWDGNQDFEAETRYKHLSETLRECNTAVVGSCYASDSSSKSLAAQTVEIPLSLEKREQEKFIRMLKDADAPLVSLLEGLVAKRETDSWTNANLFYILRELSEYSYNPEWLEVRRLTESRFNREVQANEERMENQLAEGGELNRFQTIQEIIQKHGIGTAWQMQLEKARDRLEEADPERLKTLESCKKNIQKANVILAVSSQFLVPVPISLLLRTTCGSAYSAKSAMLGEFLKVDCLVSHTTDANGYATVRFRHPAEAETYLTKNCPASKDLEELEVEALISLIQNCRWDAYSEESFQMIRLIRQFGPNSSGKYSSPVGESRGWYDDYVSWWLQIADELLKSAEGSNPEAVVVYAHLLREHHSREIQKKQDQTTGDGLLEKAADQLKNTLKQEGIPKPQRRRLLGELCANLSVSMMERQVPGTVQKDEFREFNDYFKQEMSLWTEDESSGFSVNFALDNWLNAIGNLRSSYGSDEIAMKDDFFLEQLSETMEYIDALLDLDQDQQEMTKLLGKIKELYQLCSIDRLQKLEAQTASKGKDTFLYLRANQYWWNDDAPGGSLYLIRDDPNTDPPMTEEELQELRTPLIEASRKVIECLNPKSEEIVRQSGRCMYMLLRAKWISFTQGRLPLEEKQRPRLNKDQWEEIHELCSGYLSSCRKTQKVPKLPALFLEAIWHWQFGNIKEANDRFNECKNRKKGDYFIQRIGCCIPGTDQLRTFQVDTYVNSNGNCRAELRKELSVPGSAPTVAGYKDLFISDHVLRYLTGSGTPVRKYNLSKPVVVWFNTAGASLGLPIEGGIDNER